ncbi:hypothetical protein H9P43_002890 [Blastocladiella emersonii ATCC 22665]|nr:hypothetical protein H9P43_002890 [Blastocladiella emersonii ATCC 22665]
MTNPPAPLKRAVPQVGKGIRQFADAAAKCSAEGAAYGKCITDGYKDVRKDMCAKEFESFKACMTRQMKRRW